MTPGPEGRPDRGQSSDLNTSPARRRNLSQSKTTPPTASTTTARLIHRCFGVSTASNNRIATTKARKQDSMVRRRRMDTSGFQRYVVRRTLNRHR